ncbi:MAG: sulfurtransferase TusA family protein [Nitrospiria bacterium]
MITADHILDTLGLYCPLPVILTSKKIKEMAEHQILEVLSDDEGIIKDMPIWCKNSGNELLDLRQEGDIVKLYVRKLGNASN